MVNAEAGDDYDDDGRLKRTGTMFTASAHIITAVIGSGVLSLAWAMAQLGWIAGTLSLAAFSVITSYMSTLQADCYRNPVTGRRNYSYMDAVKNSLGAGFQYKLCGLAQYVNLVGSSIGYTITASISLAAVKRSNCFHKYGHHVGCHTSNNPYILGFGVSQLFLSQLPNFHKLSALSSIAAVMSFGYSFIGAGLSIAQVAGGNSKIEKGLTGTAAGVDVTSSQKIWNTFSSLGNIAFAYAFSSLLIEIQDTLKSSPPENNVMKKATLWAIIVTTVFYMICGLVGYAAFGNDAPGNFLTGFGFYEPFWLIDVANLFIAIHLVGAYQVYCQPFFAFFEAFCSKKWPDSKFINKEVSISLPCCGIYPLNFFKLVWRTIYVIATMVIAMLFPFFNDIVGLLGAVSFWPLAVHFPTEMYIAQKKIPRFSWSGLLLRLVSIACLVISLAAAVSSIQGLIVHVQEFKPFHSES